MIALTSVNGRDGMFQAMWNDDAALLDVGAPVVLAPGVVADASRFRNPLNIQPLCHENSR